MRLVPRACATPERCSFPAQSRSAMGRAANLFLSPANQSTAEAWNNFCIQIERAATAESTAATPAERIQQEVRSTEESCVRIGAAPSTVQGSTIRDRAPPMP